MTRLQIEFCEFPEDVLYDFENNLWVKLRDESAQFGITSVHASFAGRLNEVKFTRPERSAIMRGQSVATIESSKYFGAVRAPLSGTIIELNRTLETKPKLANDFPYEQGWFVKIRPTVDAEIGKLLHLQGSEDKIRAQIRELHARCFKAYPDHDLWEIGVECGAVLVRLNELIERCQVGEVIHVVSDDPTADIEMIRWADQTGQDVLESRQEENLTHFIVKKVKG
jgi:glycine cleavage system H lipoate-binding protein/TusA-related sulfurtransferase